jgi:branched-chain amino acid transport system substrate-binding protein
MSQRRSSRSTLFGAGITTLALVLAACGGDDEGDGGSGGGGGGDEFVIGYAADFSDFGAIGDNPGTSGAEYMVQLLNEQGGVCGKQIRFEVKTISQTPPDPVAAKRGVRELIEAGAEVILGPPFSDYGFPILDETNAELPVLFVTSTEVSLSDVSRGSFLMSFNDLVQSSAAAEFALKQGWTNGVTLSSSDIPYLSVNPTGFAEIFTAGGGTVKDITYSLGATDFSSQVNEIAAMDPQPDVIYSAFFLPEAGTFLTQLREAGVQSAVIGADGFEASFIWSVPAAEGVYFTSHTFAQESNGVQAFLDGHAATDLPEIETPSFGVLGADAVQLAVAAKAANCDGDPKSLIDTVANLENVTVTSGTNTYKGTAGTPKRDVVISQVINGQPVVAEAFFPATVAEG